MSPAVSSTRRGALASGFALLSGCTSLPPESQPRTADSDSRSADVEARLGFVGDVMFGRGVNETRSGQQAGSVWGDVLSRLDALDGLFLNLECCLSDRGEPTPGRRYHFRADPEWAVPALERSGTSWAGLANNHVLDYGPIAFEDTVSALDGADIALSGAGQSRRDAFAPARVDVGGLDVSVVAVTDRAPTYAAGSVRSGTAYLPMLDDPVTLTGLSTAIRRAQDDRPDLLVASLHWGPNWVTRPAGRYRRLARWLVDAGVDVVHGHSAHVFQGIEVYRGRPIIHDAGDFVDDYALVDDLHNDRSFLFEVHISNDRPVELRLHPTVIRDEAVYLASDETDTWLRQRIEARSEPFGTRFQRNGDTFRVELADQD